MLSAAIMCSMVLNDFRILKWNTQNISLGWLDSSQLRKSLQWTRHGQVIVGVLSSKRILMSSSLTLTWRWRGRSSLTTARFSRGQMGWCGASILNMFTWRRLVWQVNLQVSAKGKGIECLRFTGCWEKDMDFIRLLHFRGPSRMTAFIRLPDFSGAKLAVLLQTDGRRKDCRFVDESWLQGAKGQECLLCHDVSPRVSFRGNF